MLRALQRQQEQKRAGEARPQRQDYSKIIAEFVYPYKENETINHRQLEKDVEKLVHTLSRPVVIGKKKVWIS